MSDNRQNPRPASQQARRAPSNRGGRPPVRRRRKKRATGRFYVILAILALAAVAVGVIIGMSGDSGDSAKPAAATAAPDNAFTDSASVAPIATLPPLEDLSEYLGSEDAVITGLTADQMVTVDDLSITPGLPEEWMHILLLGGDARSKTESSRTDSIMICSINKKTGEVKLTSILRDTAITFDDIGKYNDTYRINIANFFGGPRLAMKTVNECLNLNIEYYVMVDFTSFSVIAEGVGGIELTITEEEMTQINKNAYQQYRLAKYAGIDESAIESTNVVLEQFGEDVHLNGRQALGYARIRNLDSDIGRAERQRKVLEALLDKLKSRSPSDIVLLSTSMFKYVSTNMSPDDILNTALMVVASGFEDVEQMRIPVKDSYVTETRGGQAMLYDTNWELNAQQFYSFIYE